MSFHQERLQHLQRGLHQLYDSVAAEPIPAELLRLIEADKARDKG